ncbi:hypothetical protein SUDANB106_01009 [Streptomyces sp. enrichment culture]|uniref:hypothetical protein n=1 Tax=Streptomyces sp. enrichment culture TaxID=1795815 RepID=UPI003F57106D
MQLPADSAPAPSAPPLPAASPSYVPPQPGPAGSSAVAGRAPSSPAPSPAAPAHTRARAPHWLATAAALGALLGASALLEPAGADATQPRETAAVTPGPDADTARYPLDCGPVEAEVVDRAAVDFDGDGRAETVAVVRCAAGIGTPPSGVYVLAHPAREGGRPRVAETLVDPEEGMTVQDLTVRDRTVFARLLGYSSPDVPRCCPDRARDVEWEWRGGKFVLEAAPTARSV